MAIPVWAQGTIYPEPVFNESPAANLGDVINLRLTGTTVATFDVKAQPDIGFQDFVLETAAFSLPIGEAHVTKAWIDFDSDGVWDSDSTSLLTAQVQCHFPPPTSGFEYIRNIRVKYRLVRSVAPFDTWEQVFEVPLRIRATPRKFLTTRGDWLVSARDETFTSRTPVLIVEGFDPTNTSTTTDVLLKFESITAPLQAEGYSCFALSFADGGAYLQDNAQVLRAALQKLHSLSPDKPIGVIGISMGGVISRYALARAEAEGLDLGVRLFVSFDSPQQGAQANRALQDFLHSHMDMGAVAAVAAPTTTPAAKQLLTYNAWDNWQLHRSFFSELNFLNEDGYPKRSRNVAISNGALEFRTRGTELFPRFWYLATHGAWRAGSEFATFQVSLGNGLYTQTYDLRADPADVGPGSMSPAPRVKTGQIFPYSEVLGSGYKVTTDFDPVFIPTQSALDLVSPRFNQYGDIEYTSSRFDETYTGSTPTYHVTITDGVRTSLLGWVHQWLGETICGNPAPQLIRPENGADVTRKRSVTLAWRHCGASQYEVVVSTLESFLSPVFSGAVPDQILRLDRSLPYGTYYWKVRPILASGFGAWSEVRSFGWHPATFEILGPRAVTSTTPRVWSLSSIMGTGPFTIQWQTYGYDHWYDVPNGNGTTVSGVWLDTRGIPLQLRCVVTDSFNNVTIENACIASGDEPAAPSVTITGPTGVPPYGVGTWTAQAQYGRTCEGYGYSWRWRAEGQSIWSDVVSEGPTLTLSSIAPSRIEVKVEVTGVEMGVGILQVDMNAPDNGCPMVDVLTPAGWQEENSILGRSLTGQPMLDMCRMRSLASTTDDEVKIRIRENESESSVLDEVRLVAIDHDSTVRAYAVGEGIFLGRHVPPRRVVTQSGADITDYVAGPGSPGYLGSTGDTLYVDVAAPELLKGTVGVAGDDFGIRIDDGDGGDGGKGSGATTPGTYGRAITPQEVDAAIITRTGILIEEDDGAGGWALVSHRHPREHFDESCLGESRSTRLRVVFLSPHRLWYIGRIEPSRDSMIVNKLALRAAMHSRLGDVMALLTEHGNVSTTIENGDTVNLTFGWPRVPQGLVRETFLLSHGAYSSVLPARPGVEPTVRRFSAGPNVPNPFVRGSTTIRLSLPVASDIRVEIFDVTGRRIRSLLAPAMPAGHQSISWDGRDDVGALARPGVFLCAVHAGKQKAQFKMVMTK